jgi:hypothetical protein
MQRAVETAVGEADDDFGDFGGVEAAEDDVAAVVDAKKDESYDDFGDFGSVEAVEDDLTAVVGTKIGDSYDDFGDFGGVEAAKEDRAAVMGAENHGDDSPVTEVADAGVTSDELKAAKPLDGPGFRPSESSDSAGSEGTDVAEEEVAAPIQRTVETAVREENDDFGDFGAVEDDATAEVGTENDDSDDGFGDFGATESPVTEVADAAVTSDVVEAAEPAAYTLDGPGLRPSESSDSSSSQGTEVTEEEEVTAPVPVPSASVSVQIPSFEDDPFGADLVTSPEVDDDPFAGLSFGTRDTPRASELVLQEEGPDAGVEKAETPASSEVPNTIATVESDSESEEESAIEVPRSKEPVGVVEAVAEVPVDVVEIAAFEEGDRGLRVAEEAPAEQAVLNDLVDDVVEHVAAVISDEDEWGGPAPGLSAEEAIEEMLGASAPAETTEPIIVEVGDVQGGGSEGAGFDVDDDNIGGDDFVETQAASFDEPILPASASHVGSSDLVGLDNADNETSAPTDDIKAASTSENEDGGGDADGTGDDWGGFEDNSSATTAPTEDVLADSAEAAPTVEAEGDGKIDPDSSSDCSSSSDDGIAGGDDGGVLDEGSIPAADTTLIAEGEESADAISGDGIVCSDDGGAVGVDLGALSEAHKATTAATKATLADITEAAPIVENEGGGDSSSSDGDGDNEDDFGAFDEAPAVASVDIAEDVPSVEAVVGDDRGRSSGGRGNGGGSDGSNWGGFDEADTIPVDVDRAAPDVDQGGNDSSSDSGGDKDDIFGGFDEAAAELPSVEADEVDARGDGSGAGGDDGGDNDGDGSDWGGFGEADKTPQDISAPLPTGEDKGAGDSSSDNEKEDAIGGLNEAAANTTQALSTFEAEGGNGSSGGVDISSDGGGAGDSSDWGGFDEPDNTVTVATGAVPPAEDEGDDVGGSRDSDGNGNSGDGDHKVEDWGDFDEADDKKAVDTDIVEAVPTVVSSELGNSHVSEAGVSGEVDDWGGFDDAVATQPTDIAVEVDTVEIDGGDGGGIDGDEDWGGFGDAATATTLSTDVTEAASAAKADDGDGDGEDDDWGDFDESAVAAPAPIVAPASLAPKAGSSGGVIGGDFVAQLIEAEDGDFLEKVTKVRSVWRWG